MHQKSNLSLYFQKEMVNVHNAMVKENSQYLVLKMNALIVMELAFVQHAEDLEKYKACPMNQKMKFS